MHLGIFEISAYWTKYYKLWEEAKQVTGLISEWYQNGGLTVLILANEAGELELIKIRYTYFGSSWVKARETFTEVTKLVEATRFLFHFISYVG